MAPQSGDKKMVRFIDLRYQGTGARFAFFDTVINSFVGEVGAQAWNDWAEAEGDLRKFCGRNYLMRVKTLCPPWALEPMVDENEAFGFEEDRPK